MAPDSFLTRILDPGLDFLAGIGGPTPTDDARRFLLAIAMQESGPNLDARYQNHPATSAGPARGFWQFEQGGGVTGVLNHPVSQQLARAACNEHAVQAHPAAVWRGIEGHDVLAAVFARLLVLTDPFPVPTTQDAAWDCYVNRLWRPGKPHPDTWASNWATADATVRANPRKEPEKPEEPKP